MIMKDFFQGFNFDTLLALISCITGIVALFLGGSAYKKCRVTKDSLNDKNKYGDNCTDNSQKAGGDIINNSCDVQALTNLTRENFQVSLNQAYSFFEQKTTDNLQRIIEETQKIIQENQIDIGSYTKVDWINVYFENAKTTSDEFMQNVWAKVLAKEMESSGTFSFQTLSILRNMSTDDFRIFETMCSVQVNHNLLHKSLYDNYDMGWIKFLRMKELGLLNLDSSEITTTILPHREESSFYCNKYVVLLKNKSDSEVEHKLNIYLLSSSAIELMSIVDMQANEEFIIDYAREISKNMSENLKISVHKINYFYKGGYNYFKENLLEIYDNQTDNTIT